MYQITQITEDAVQTQTLLTPESYQIPITLKFVPMQAGWFLTNLQYQSFQIQGLRITNNPNMLRQYKGVIPFGLACFSLSYREPSLIEDFFSGYSSLYILSHAEVLQYENYLRGIN